MGTHLLPQLPAGMTFDLVQVTFNLQFIYRFKVQFLFFLSPLHQLQLPPPKKTSPSVLRPIILSSFVSLSPTRRDPRVPWSFCRHPRTS